MEKTTGLLKTYYGRDKILRTTSFVAMLLAPNTKGQLSQNLGILGKQIGSARTILRLFDDLLMVANTYKYGWGKQERDPVTRFLTILGNLAGQAYFPVEHVAWAADNKMISIQSRKWWVAAVALWAVSVFIGILKSLQAMGVVRRNRAKLVKQKKLESPDKSDAADVSFKQAMKELKGKEWNEFLNMVRCGSDFTLAINWLPKGFLWAGKFSEGQCGLFGTISSLIGLYQMVSAQ